MSDAKTTIKQLKDLAEQFRKERNWGKHHSPRNLAISIAIEAAELMEKFQWDDYQDKNASKEVEDELADIMVYCLYLSIVTGIDISKAIDKKLKKAAKKYPAGIELDSDDYWRIKKEHRGK